MRIVADTHVIFSGASFTQSYTGQIMRAWLIERRIQIVLSPDISHELARVIHYPFVVNRYHWSEEEEQLFLRVLHRKAHVIKNPPIIRVSKDPKDDMFFACAKAANVPYIVSKDEDDILAVGEYEGIKIVKPGYFVHHVLPTLTSKAA